jgi:hypothetical protein
MDMRASPVIDFKKALIKKDTMDMTDPLRRQSTLSSAEEIQALK